ncbi:MAG: hypothetical protein E7604_14610 [Ruminococcaceae bacterium]|nr:hypothetical protein [Oscillospiraceae bacterium]
MRNNQFVRMTALLLLASSALLACGDQTEQPAVTNAVTEDSAAVTTEAVTEDNRPALELPEMDFGGAQYRISSVEQADADSLVVDEINGEAVNDLIFERNAYLCETYNFDFVSEVAEDGTTHEKAVAKVILAGEDAWELIYGNCVLTCNNAIDGVYANWYEVPHVDFDQPWYPAQTVEQMTINDKMFTVASGINYKQLDSAKVLIFNKNMLAANDLETPYQSVLDGTWTMDRLISQTKDLYQDINGDSKRDLGDQYGFITHPEQNGFLMSCNAQVLSKTADGGLEFSVVTDKMASLVEKLYGWYYESGDVFLGSFRANEDDFSPKVFIEGRAAYTFAHLSHAPTYYRESDINYGIAPMPKFDEQQESYYVFACPSMFSVPISCQNLEFAGFVFEAMTYYGYYDVTPAYYELTLQGKIADSQDDVAMLEIINNNLTASFAYCYDNWQGFAHLLGERMKFNKNSGTKDLASAFEKYKKSAQRRLDTVLAGFADE